MSKVYAVLALLACMMAPASSKDRPGDQLRKLRAEFRDLERTSAFGVQQAEQVRIIREIAALDEIAAIQYLVDIARNAKYARLHEEVLRQLAEHSPDSVTVATLFKEHMLPGDPSRELARTYLLDRAIKRRDDPWLQSLFSVGSLEDRFHALAGMGQIGSPRTLDAARRLARSTSWQPRPDTPISCGTIAASLKDLEGADAARLLLLLRKDRRFTEADAQELREATRLWARRDPQDYVDISELADPDPEKRAEMAEFLGAAGIEEARAPLVRLAFNRQEASKVRARAAEALGSLTLARGDLARVLGDLANVADPKVRRGAIHGLARLKVRQAAEQLVFLLDGRFDAEARSALVRLSGLPADTDWATWIEGRACRLPRGT